jgi:hypothetical protein
MESDVYKLISEKKQPILKKWQSAALGSSVNMAMRRKLGSRFSDPTGYVIEQSTGEILEWLIRVENDVDLFAPLEQICKLKAIQDIRPAEALSFIFNLKQVIREEIADENDNFHWAVDMSEVERRIDEIGLLAFNIYSDCRAKIYELRMNEIIRMQGRGVG